MTDYSLNTSYKEGSTVLNLRVSKISGSPLLLNFKSYHFLIGTMLQKDKNMNLYPKNWIKNP